MEKFPSFEEIPQPQQEKKERSRPLALERFRKWGRLGAMVGVLFVGGERVATAEGSYSNTTSGQQVEKVGEVGRSERELTKMFGKEVVDDLRFFTTAGQAEKEKQHQKTRIVGIENSGMKDPQIFLQLWDEEGGTIPKGWLSGEVTEIKFSSGTGSQGSVEGDVDMREAAYYDGGTVRIGADNSRPIIVHSQVEHPHFNEEDRDNLPYFYDDIIAHELGHANDWINDVESTFEERTDLFLAVCERVKSEDRYMDQKYIDLGVGQYYASYDDGTTEGFKQAAKEYWAEIVAAYLTQPSNLQRDFPKDFALVDGVVKKSDSNFDAFARHKLAESTRKTNQVGDKVISVQVTDRGDAQSGVIPDPESPKSTTRTISPGVKIDPSAGKPRVIRVDIPKITITNPEGKVIE